MSDYFLDASALVKAYVEERGSAHVRSLLAMSPAITSELTIAEIASALGRRMIDGALTVSRRDELFRAFMREALDFRLVAVSQDVLARAADMLLKGVPGYVLRTSDAIHLATAEYSFILAGATGSDGGGVVASDQRMLRVAMARGLSTDDPESFE